MKVRVPKEHRPPTRFGIIEGNSDASFGKRFRVKGVYREVQQGEWYWSNIGWNIVVYAYFGPCNRAVILEEVK